MIAVLLLASPSDAHITLTFPDGRFGDPNEQKDAPCGMGGPMDQRGPNVQTFLPGETITITWNETVDHDGHFRISFDEDGQDFEDPPQEQAFYSNPLVVIDEIEDDPSQTYSEELTFPLVECTTCTLQLIQVMYEGAFGDDSIYYQCADIELTYAVEPPDTGDTGDTDTDAPVDTDTDPPPADTDDPAPPPGTGDGPGGDGADDDDGAGCFGGCAAFDLAAAPAGTALAALGLAVVVGRRRRSR